MDSRSAVTQLADNVTLTGSAVASNAALTGGRDKHALYVSYRPDTDSTNALVVTIEVSPDGTNWFPYVGAYSATNGAITQNTSISITYSSDGTAAQAQNAYYFTIPAEAVRIKFSESNTPADFGGITAWLVSTN